MTQRSLQKDLVVYGVRFNEYFTPKRHLNNGDKAAVAYKDFAEFSARRA